MLLSLRRSTPISVLVVLVAVSRTAAQLAATVSITKLPAVSSIAACDSGCLWAGYGAFYAGPVVALGCNQAVVDNGCYCKSESFSKAITAISQCMVNRCTDANAKSIAAGSSIYSSYCSDVLVNQAAPTLPATASAAASSPTSSAASPSQTVSAVPSQTASTAVSSQTATASNMIAGLSPAAFIGVVVSVVCSVIGLVFTIGFKIYKYKKQQKKEAAAEKAKGQGPGGSLMP